MLCVNTLGVYQRPIFLLYYVDEVMQSAHTKLSSLREPVLLSYQQTHPVMLMFILLPLLSPGHILNGCSLALCAGVCRSCSKIMLLCILWTWAKILESGERFKFQVCLRLTCMFMRDCHRFHRRHVMRGSSPYWI